MQQVLDHFTSDAFFPPTLLTWDELIWLRLITYLILSILKFFYYSIAYIMTGMMCYCHMGHACMDAEVSTCMKTLYKIKVIRLFLFEWIQWLRRKFG